MKSEAAKYGYTLVVVDASRDNTKQQSQVEDFISQKVSAIVLTPYDSQAIGSAIVEANRARTFRSSPPTSRAARKRDRRLARRQRQRSGRRRGGKTHVHRLERGGQRGDHRRAGSHQRAGSRQGFPGRRSRGLSERQGRRPTSTAAANAPRPTSRWKTSSNRIKTSKASSASTTIRARRPRAVEAAGLKGKVFVIGYDATPRSAHRHQSGSMYGDAIQHPDQSAQKRSTPSIITSAARSRPPRSLVPVGTFTEADAK